MTRDEIISMAREAGIVTKNYDAGFMDLFTAKLERFAALVAAAEREACAKLCDEQHDRARTSTGAARANFCAEAIRARGEKGQS